MKRELSWWAAACALVLAALPSITLAGQPDGSGAVQRPIEDFVLKQGTFCVTMGGPTCVLFEPPVGNLLGFIKIETEPEPDLRVFAKVDYAGLADQHLGGILGTTFEGSVTERPLADGRAEVTVRLHTRNALAWVTGRYRTPSGGWGPLFPLWGSSPGLVERGAAPAFADLHFHLVFTNPAMGAPLPDLTQFYFDPSYPGVRSFEAMTAHGTGALADGTPAALVLHMTGLLGVYDKLADQREARYGEGWEAPSEHGIWTDAGWPGGVLELNPIGR